LKQSLNNTSTTTSTTTSPMEMTFVRYTVVDGGYIRTFDSQEIKAKALMSILNVYDDFVAVSDWDDGTDTGVPKEFVNEWWQVLYNFSGDEDFADIMDDIMDDNDSWLKLAQKYHPDVDLWDVDRWEKRKKSPLPEDFPPVLLEMVKTVYRIREGLKVCKDKDKDLDYLIHFHSPDVMSYTFLQWLYAKKFPGKSVEDAVSVFLETQPALFKARKEKLAREMAQIQAEMQKCDAGLLACCENVVVANMNKNKKRKTQEY